MGVDQSTPGVRSQRDENIPYTSYSISRPINSVYRSQNPATDSPQSSPLPRHRSGEGDDVVSGSSGGIVTVHPELPATCVEQDAELKKLHEIPMFLPLLKSSINLPASRDEQVEKLDSRALLHYCVRYQEHLKQCAEAVAFDQNQICMRMKEVDASTKRLCEAMAERQKKFAKYAEQLNKVQEMTATLARVRSHADRLEQLLDELNSQLPESEQLEPFCFRPPEQGVIN